MTNTFLRLALVEANPRAALTAQPQAHLTSGPTFLETQGDITLPLGPRFLQLGSPFRLFLPDPNLRLQVGTGQGQ